MKLELSVPVKAVTTLNSRTHWAIKAKAAKREQLAVHMAWARAKPKVDPVLRVTLTRVGPRQLDSDNLASALKGVRDGLAKKLRIDDGSPLVEWAYHQEQGEYCVRVVVESLVSTRWIIPD